MSEISNLRAARDRVEKDLSRKRGELEDAHRKVRTLTGTRDELKKNLKQKRKRDPETEDRIRELEREIERMAEHLRHMNKVEIPKAEGEVRQLTRRIDDLRTRREKIVNKIQRWIHDHSHKGINTSAGSPHWGGSEDILQNECDPVARRYGIPVTSIKRSATDPLTISNPGSDHSVLATTASAHDYGTFSGANFAHSVASALGIGGYSTGNYNNYYIVRNGTTFRVQILWAVAGHYNHVHVGIRRV